MIPPIICISLTDAIDRRAFISEQLAARGLDYRFLDAIRPDLSQGWPASYQRQKRLTLHGHDLTCGEIGCYLSHRQAWEEFLASDAPCCCILEDDVALQDGFRETLTELCGQAEHWDIVRLFGVFPRQSAKLRKLSGGRWLVDYFEQPRGTQGYVLTRAAAARLLQHTAAMFCAIDDAIDRGWEHRLRLYGIEPYLVIEQTQHASTIGNRQRSRLPWWRRVLRELHRSQSGLQKQLWVWRKRLQHRRLAQALS